MNCSVDILGYIFVFGLFIGVPGCAFLFGLIFTYADKNKRNRKLKDNLKVGR